MLNRSSFNSRYFILFAFIFTTFIIQCTQSDKSSDKKISDGLYRGELQLQDQHLPFNFEVKTVEGKQQWVLLNADERLELNEVRMEGDSVFVPLFIFDASIEAQIKNDGSLTGYYVKHDTEEVYQIPMTAKLGTGRFIFENEANASALVDGKWSIEFTLADGRISEAVGVFESTADGRLSGSILKPTGDFRYLEGEINGNEVRLSTFDGAHAYLLKATLSVDGQRLENGHFYSGKTRHDLFTAVKNDLAKLPDANSLTYLKEGYEQFSFEFPDLNGEMVSLEDDRFKDKAVIVQIFGTWCPNCMDETIFLKEWYANNKQRGVEIVALAYEAKDDYEYAVNRVKRMQNKLNVDYIFLIAGVNDNEKASESLPMLNRVVAFPTMIILNKDKEIESIHTGFSGPGTGEYYTNFVEDFNELMDVVLSQ